MLNLASAHAGSNPYFTSLGPVVSLSQRSQLSMKQSPSLRSQSKPKVSERFPSTTVAGYEKDSLVESLGKRCNDMGSQQLGDDDMEEQPTYGAANSLIEAFRNMRSRIYGDYFAEASSLESGSSVGRVSSRSLPTDKDQHARTMRGSLYDAELLAVLDPLLLECPARGFCYAVPPVFRLATMSVYTAHFVLVMTYVLPLASFVVDVALMLRESGRTTCIAYTSMQAVMLVSLAAVSVWFTCLHRPSFWNWKLEQIFVLIACLTLLVEKSSKVYKLLPVNGVDEFCADEFNVSDFADLRFFQVLNFCFNYLMFEVFRSFSLDFRSFMIILITVFAELAFIWSVHSPKGDEEKDEKTFDYEFAQWFETIRIFIVIHKAYVAYMELSKRSYLRTRSRQLAFWILAGPLCLHSLLFISGKQFAVLYNQLDPKHKLSLNAENAFVGEVFVTEIKYLLFVFLFAKPDWVQSEEEPVRIVRAERACESFSNAPKAEQATKRHRNNIFGSFGLEAAVKCRGPSLRPTFCLETALWAFNCSYLVYFDDPISGSKYPMPPSDLETACLMIRKFFNDPLGSNCACIFTAANRPWRIFVSFRGTASLTNVATDITAWGKQVEFGREQEKFWVHQGFNKAYKTIGAIMRMELYSYVKTLLQSGVSTELISITFCGHSLGGALATLMGVDSVDMLGELGISRVNVYTFGAPRVGDQDFANWANSKIPHIFRICGTADPIPRVPNKRAGILLSLTGLPIWLYIRSLLGKRQWQVLITYRHVGYEVSVNRQQTGDLLIAPEITDQLFWMSWFVVPTDHLFTAYRAAMFASIFYLKGEDETDASASCSLMDTE